MCEREAREGRWETSMWVGCQLPAADAHRIGWMTRARARRWGPHVSGRGSDGWREHAASGGGHMSEGVGGGSTRVGGHMSARRGVWVVGGLQAAADVPLTCRGGWWSPRVYGRISLIRWTWGGLLLVDFQPIYTSLPWWIWNFSSIKGIWNFVTCLELVGLIMGDLGQRVHYGHWPMRCCHRKCIHKNYWYRNILHRKLWFQMKMDHMIFCSCARKIKHMVLSANQGKCGKFGLWALVVYTRYIQPKSLIF